MIGNKEKHMGENIPLMQPYLFFVFMARTSRTFDMSKEKIGTLRE